MKRISYIMFLVVFSGFVSISSAFAWQIELSNSDSSLVAGETYSLDIIFHGEETDNLASYSANIIYNTDLVEFITVQHFDYDSGAPYFSTIFDGGIMPFDSETFPGIVTNILGSEPMGTNDAFYPVRDDQTRLATVWFTANATGDFEDIVEFFYDSTIDLLPSTGVLVNGELVVNDQIAIFEDGTSSVLSPVPVPAAVWLLGSGLVGLIGFRKKRNA